MNGPPVAAFVADVHVGNPSWCGGAPEAGVNRRGKLVLDSLRAAVAQARGMGARHFVVLGDLFNTSRATPQHVAAVMELLGPSAQGMAVHALLGNHDQESDAPGDNALSPLRHVGVRVHETDTVVAVTNDGRIVGELWMVPYRGGPASEWLPPAVAALHAASLRASAKRRPPVTLCLHLGVSDARTPVYLRGAPDSIDVDELVRVCATAGVRTVVAGNWHERRAWNRSVQVGEQLVTVDVLQVGALSPTGFNNPGLEGYGTLAWVEEDGVLRHHVAGGPRFVVVRSEQEFSALVARVRTVKLTDAAGLPTHPATFVRWVVDGDSDALEHAAGLVRTEVELGVLLGGEAVPDPNRATQRARRAVQAARHLPTIEERFNAYVGARGLPEERGAAVLRTCIAYLRGGAHAT